MSWRAWMLVVDAIALVAGCLQPASEACESGGVCPPGLACARTGTGQVCVQSTCGDGQLDPREVCDDGNNVSGDGCPGDCSAPCGDGVPDPGEDCDDGNAVAGDGCSADCRYERCGDGLLDPSEACDDGNLTSHDGCSQSCSAETAAWLAVEAAPPARTHFAMAYDAARGAIVAFGGLRGDGRSSETWEWDGAVWRQRSPRRSPPPRTGHAMAYDASRARIVMFGGGGRAEHSTWEWDGGQWHELLPPAVSDGAPASQLSDAAMAYDAARHRVVLFGGRLDGVDQDRTWEWDGERWRALGTLDGPTARSGHAMAYDSRRGRIVLFGGAAGAQSLADTWELDGAIWRARATAAAPPPRARAAMGFDVAAGEIVVFGGDGAGGALGDTWSWNGSAWRARSSGRPPRPRSAAGMVYDLSRGALTLFGGQQTSGDEPTGAALLADTWAWRGGTGGDWLERTVHAGLPAARQAHGMAFDPTRGLVMFGGAGAAGELGDAWAWDGARWTAIAAPVDPAVPESSSPGARRDFATAAMAGRLVVFGGRRGDQLLDDTWRLDDAGWAQLPALIAPPPRWAAAAAYDAARGRLVVFGGHATADGGAENLLGDTWEWEGSRWTRRNPPHAPLARAGHAMAYDAARARVVLFGGTSNRAVLPELNDVWEWDGSDWLERKSGDRPPAGQPTRMAYDVARARIVVIAGATTWEWDGAVWVDRTPPTQPPVHEGAALAYDPVRGRLAMIGGLLVEDDAGQRALSAEIWECDGTAWHRIAPASGLPPPRSAAAMSYDAARGEAIAFGGTGAAGELLGDTWSWNGATWRELALPAPPPPRSGHAMAFDAGRRKIVLLGGLGASGAALGETWEWDGARWQLRSTPMAPPPRAGHAMAYDAARHQTVVVGGASRDREVLGDQWAWNGLVWIRQTPATLLPPRTQLAAAYDTARDRIVAFGGVDRAGARLGDTWEWDGARWLERTPPGSPAPRSGHALVYDPASRRTLLFGGTTARGDASDAWAWDGATWLALQPASLPPVRGQAAAAFDPLLGALVVFGGAPARGDTWLLRRGDLAIPDEACHSGFDGDGDGKLGCGDPDCSALCTACGDGVCDGVESCRVCPADCGGCDACGDFACDPGETCTSCPGDCGTCSTEAP